MTVHVAEVFLLLTEEFSRLFYHREHENKADKRRADGGKRHDGVRCKHDYSYADKLNNALNKGGDAGVER